MQLDVGMAQFGCLHMSILLLLRSIFPLPTPSPLRPPPASPFQRNLDISNQAWWPAQVINRWLSVRLELMGAAIMFSAAFFVTVIIPRNPGLVGLVITAALNLTGGWGKRQGEAAAGQGKGVGGSRAGLGGSALGGVLGKQPRAGDVGAQRGKQGGHHGGCD